MSKNLYLHPDDLNLFEMNPSDRIENLEEDGSNVHHIFYANYVHFIRTYYPFDISYTRGKFESSHIFQKLINSDLHITNVNIGEEKSLMDFFANKEWVAFTSVDSPKGLLYKNFISDNRIQFKAMDALLENKHKRKYKIDFKTYAEQRVNTLLIDIEDINKVINQIFILIISRIIYEWITKNKINPQIDPNYWPGGFNVDKITTPSALLEESELIVYRKAMSDWLKYAVLEIREKITPLFNHPILEDFQKRIENDTKQTHSVDLVSHQPLAPIKNELVSSSEFPAYIFLDYKSYLLFHTIAQNTTSHPLISFVYRKMSEREKPNLIKVRPTLFMEWFDQQNYPLGQLDKPKTYIQSEKCNREDFYIIIKSLIF